MSAAESVDGDGPIWVDTLTVTIGMVGDVSTATESSTSLDSLLVPTRTRSMGFSRSCWATAWRQTPGRRRTPHRSSGRATPGTRQWSRGGCGSDVAG